MALIFTTYRYWRFISFEVKTSRDCMHTRVKDKSNDIIKSIYKIYIYEIF